MSVVSSRAAADGRAAAWRAMTLRYRAETGSQRYKLNGKDMKRHLGSSWTCPPSYCSFLYRTALLVGLIKALRDCVTLIYSQLHLR